ncbi:cation:proton antiporter [Lawsonibacter celer]|jgi:Kef-type K+ transport system membrane component KefB|uniref:cation:proton antiporter n=1 Tax=Lawsonibacter celer TaxID=2986526 RepID=UPI0016470BAB|nr:cation:proton antiporter [Lawsonibacter celer]
MSYHFLLDIALILLSTKVLGLITRKFQLPQVVGALLAGLLLGPACLNVLQGTDTLSQLAEIGVIVIMFSAGMGTDIQELKHSGKAGFWVALCGVLVPLALGAGLAFFFNRGAFAHPGNVLLQNIFIGTILTATSVSISVETLKELGRLTTRVGNTILAAALIDDVLGLICLTIVTSLGGADVNIILVLVKILLFFVFVGVVGFLFVKFFTWYTEKLHNQDLRRWPIAAFVLCLLLSYCAEEFFGVADIIGAFSAGLIVTLTPKAKYVESKFSPLSYLLLTPIFFANIGIRVELPAMSWEIVLFSVLLVAVAVLSKLIGCGLGARLSGFRGRQCVQVGVGMACRGEVALIVANKGMAMGLMPSAFFGPVIIMVVCCAILTPILLKLSFRKEDAYSDLQGSNLLDSYEAVDQLDRVAEGVLTAEQDLRQGTGKQE